MKYLFFIFILISLKAEANNFENEIKCLNSLYKDTNILEGAYEYYKTISKTKNSKKYIAKRADDKYILPYKKYSRQEAYIFTKKMIYHCPLPRFTKAVSENQHRYYLQLPDQSWQVETLLRYNPQSKIYDSNATPDDYLVVEKTEYVGSRKMVPIFPGKRVHKKSSFKIVNCTEKLTPNTRSVFINELKRAIIGTHDAYKKDYDNLLKLTKKNKLDIQKVNFINNKQNKTKNYNVSKLKNCLSIEALRDVTQKEIDLAEQHEKEVNSSGSK